MECSCKHAQRYRNICYLCVNIYILQLDQSIQVKATTQHYLNYLTSFVPLKVWKGHLAAACKARMLLSHSPAFLSSSASCSHHHDRCNMNAGIDHENTLAFVLLLASMPHHQMKHKNSASVLSKRGEVLQTALQYEGSTSASST